MKKFYRPEQPLDDALNRTIEKVLREYLKKADVVADHKRPGYLRVILDENLPAMSRTVSLKSIFDDAFDTCDQMDAWGDYLERLAKEVRARPRWAGGT